MSEPSLKLGSMPIQQFRLVAIFLESLLVHLHLVVVILSLGLIPLDLLRNFILNFLSTLVQPLLVLSLLDFMSFVLVQKPLGIFLVFRLNLIQDVEWICLLLGWHKMILSERRVIERHLTDWWIRLPRIHELIPFRDRRTDITT